ncbi:MAG: WXG100 family type VII secretion target [Chloroflexi bacterium]|nr:MAG: WXG100 family type VII secretion target [Chloroflexota bacterium]
MPAETIQANYEQLEQAARQFIERAESISQMMQHIQSCINDLQQDGWWGQGADAFYSEMEDDVLPQVKRLQGAFTQAGETAQQISQIMQEAEEQAASQFNNGGDVITASKTGDAAKFASKPGQSGPQQGNPPTGPDSSGGFHIGPPTRPDIHHDNGFTEFCANNPGDDVCSSSAAAGDYLNRAKYEALLRGAQALGHLDDGTEAYSHYLYGNGEDWHFDYGEFINEDPNGKIIYNNIMAEAQRNVEVIGQGRDRFSVTSDPFAIGGGDPRFPYPNTENWQKAIGAHQVWTSADVTVTTNEAGQRVYTMEITFHAEDRYNFNPGAADIATGALDRDNGRFEVLGWAKPFMSYGETTTTVTWVEGDIPGSQFSEDNPARRTDRRNDRRGEIGDR